MIGRRRKATRHRRRVSARPATVALTGILTLIVIGAFVYLAENAYNGIPFLSYRYVYASMPNIGHLKEHDPVDIAGVRVGQVLKTTTKNNRALVELQLTGVGPLPVDTQVVVRANGLLGSRYVELDPGQSHQMLANKGTLTETNALTTYTWGVPEALNLFDARTRTALGNMINGLGQGLEGRGTQLNEAIHVGPPSGHNFDLTAYAILARKGAPQTFFPNLDSGFSALNSASPALENTFHPGAVTANAFIDQRAATDQTIALFPSAEQNIDQGFAPNPGLRFWSSLVTLSNAAAPVLPKLPGALSSLNQLLTQSQAPLKQAKPLLDEVPPAVPAALKILNSASPDLPRLTSAFNSLVDPVTNLAIHGCDIQNFATGARSLVNYGTVPGGNWGPDVGFPLSVIAGPQETGPSANFHIPYPTENAYDKPCAYAPGPVFNESTFLQVLAGVFR